MSAMVKCVVCTQNIEGRILSAMGNTYHPEHFLCTRCQQPITDDKFQVKDGLPYCDADFAAEFLTKCYACQEPIRDRIIKAMGHDWHEEHFVCYLCKKELAALNFIDKDGEAICQKCYNNNFADKCKACGKPILERTVLALNEKWHPDCFKCSKCSKPVTEDTFQVDSGRPLCSRCS